MTDTDVLTGLGEIIHEIAGIPAEQVVPTASFSDDLDLDSLTMVEVVVACEERFGVRIPDDDVPGLKTVSDAVAYVHRASVPA
ncbi:MAG TPA: acyl carrier protein [Mycobacteriales bacterium]|jgi:acyl carrier protein|nr:acyl carrier protein [Mycobacteriales bacterium]